MLFGEFRRNRPRPTAEPGRRAISVRFTFDLHMDFDIFGVWAALGSPETIHWEAVNTQTTDNRP